MAPLSLSPLSPRQAGLSPVRSIPVDPWTGGNGTGKHLGLARAEEGFGVAMPVLVPALS